MPAPHREAQGVLQATQEGPMNFLICLIRGHVPTPVKVIDVWMVHGFGLQTLYEPDPDGDRLGCERCGRLLIEKDKS